MKTEFKTMAAAIAAVETVTATPKGMEIAQGAFSFLENSIQSDSFTLRNLRVKAMPILRTYFDGSTEESTFNEFASRVLGLSGANKDGGNTQVKQLIKLSKIAIDYPEVLESHDSIDKLVASFVNVKDENGKSVSGKYRPKAEAEAEQQAKIEALSPLEQLQMQLRTVQSELKRKKDAIKTIEDAIRELEAKENELNQKIKSEKKIAS